MRAVANALRGMVAVLVLGAVVLTFGFGFFVRHIHDEGRETASRADGIIALTGGADRITDAIDLLASGQAPRLLITGVDSRTSVEALAHHAPRLRQLLTCCIDIDHTARNTVGNAVAAKAWAGRAGMRSLLVVTSSYHMPRSLVELKRVLPDTELIPAPVVTDRMRDGDAWRDPAFLKTVCIEYLKFVAAAVRARLTPPPRSVDIASIAGNPR
jgi:uncharacterized SAM-binding protein YcdF (DUF218 family)